MDDFDIDFNDEIGTSVSKLKNGQQFTNTNVRTNDSHDTDIDYDKIIESLHNSDTFANTQDGNMRPKREINMNQFARNMEVNLDNFNSREPLPVNFTHQMMNSSQNKLIEQIEQLEKTPQDSVQMTKTPEENQGFRGILSRITNFEYIDIILYVLIFMLLNNKFIIGLIYRAPFIRTIASPYPNLIIRSLIFGLSIYLIKKFNL